MQTATAAPRFDALLKVRCTDGMRSAVAQAARRRHLSSSDCIRQLLLDRLLAEGLSLAGDASRPEAA
jgi:hypothetical protein